MSSRQLTLWCVSIWRAVEVAEWEEVLGAGLAVGTEEAVAACMSHLVEGAVQQCSLVLGTW